MWAIIIFDLASSLAAFNYREAVPREYIATRPVITNEPYLQTLCKRKYVKILFNNLINRKTRKFKLSSSNTSGSIHKK